MELKEALEKFKSIQKVYSEKRHKMDSWKSDFQQLETEIKDLIESFEKVYQESELTEEFREDSNE
jgi:hypothetical protein